MAKRKGPAPSNFPWDKIRDAYMLGEPARAICARYPGLKEGTIRCRASRHNWTTPRNIRRKAAEDLAAVNAAAARGEISGSEARARKEVIETTVETLAARQEAHASMVAKIAGTKLRKQRLPAIKTWKDADIADRMVRRALKMDEESPDAVVNVGVLSGAGQVQEVSEADPAIEAEVQRRLAEKEAEIRAYLSGLPPTEGAAPDA